MSPLLLSLLKIIKSFIICFCILNIFKCLIFIGVDFAVGDFMQFVKSGNSFRKIYYLKSIAKYLPPFLLFIIKLLNYVKVDFLSVFFSIFIFECSIFTFGFFFAISESMLVNNFLLTILLFIIILTVNKIDDKFKTRQRGFPSAVASLECNP